MSIRALMAVAEPALFFTVSFWTFVWALQPRADESSRREHILSACQAGDIWCVLAVLWNRCDELAVVSAISAVFFFLVLRPRKAARGRKRREKRREKREEEARAAAQRRRQPTEESPVQASMGMPRAHVVHQEPSGSPEAEGNVRNVPTRAPSPAERPAQVPARAPATAARSPARHDRASPEAAARPAPAIETRPRLVRTRSPAVKSSSPTSTRKKSPSATSTAGRPRIALSSGALFWANVVERQQREVRAQHREARAQEPSRGADEFSGNSRAPAERAAEASLPARHDRVSPEAAAARPAPAIETRPRLVRTRSPAVKSSSPTSTRKKSPSATSTAGRPRIALSSGALFWANVVERQQREVRAQQREARAQEQSRGAGEFSSNSRAQSASQARPSPAFSLAQRPVVAAASCSPSGRLAKASLHYPRHQILEDFTEDE